MEEILEQLTRIADALEGIRADRLQETRVRKKFQRGYWTPEEDLIILENWKTHTPKAIADILYEKGYSRAPESVKTRYYKVLRKYKDDVEGRKYIQYTQKEIETIRHLREDEHMMFKDIAKKMVELGYPKRWTSSYIQTYNNTFKGE